jgi:PAS domain S-box-containing protein
LTDIDDRKRAEQALAASERNLQLIIDTTPALIWSANTEGGADSINQHYLDYVRLPLEKLRQFGWLDAVHPEDLNGLLSVWKTLLEAGTAGETEARLRRHDGVYRWFLFRVQPLRDENGRIVKWHGVNIDIEDRKQAEDELRQSEAFLAQGEAVSETGSFLWNLELESFRWSEQLYRIFEWENGSPVTTERIATRVHPQDLADVEEMVKRAQAGLNTEFVRRLLMPDGAVKYLHFVARSGRDRDGRLTYLGSVQDVTERRLAEEALNKVRSELAHASRTMSLGILTASIAHEVNQPLSGIVTNASTCQRMLAVDPPNLEGARSTAQRTLRDAHRASDVIQRLRILFARKEPMTERIALNEAAQEVLALSSSELRDSRIIVQTDFDSALPDVIGDRVQLQQVILNLILNAADAMRDTKDRPRDLAIDTIRENAREVRLSVRDSGSGIEPENAAKLFEAFYTTKSKGMGVGLSISRSIVESHAGRIWAMPNDGPGATFSFTVPCAPERSASPTDTKV